MSSAQTYVPKPAVALSAEAAEVDRVASTNLGQESDELRVVRVELGKLVLHVYDLLVSERIVGRDSAFGDRYGHWFLTPKVEGTFTSVPVFGRIPRMGVSAPGRVSSYRVSP